MQHAQHVVGSAWERPKLLQTCKYSMMNCGDEHAPSCWLRAGSSRSCVRNTLMHTPSSAWPRLDERSDPRPTTRHWIVRSKTPVETCATHERKLQHLARFGHTLPFKTASHTPRHPTHKTKRRPTPCSGSRRSRSPLRGCCLPTRRCGSTRSWTLRWCCVSGSLPCRRRGSGSRRRSRRLQACACRTPRPTPQSTPRRLPGVRYDPPINIPLCIPAPLFFLAQGIAQTAPATRIPHSLRNRLHSHSCRLGLGRKGTCTQQRSIQSYTTFSVQTG